MLLNHMYDDEHMFGLVLDLRVPGFLCDPQSKAYSGRLILPPPTN